MVRLTCARCIYCGLPCARVREGDRIVREITCTGHTDLPALDPWFGIPDHLEEVLSECRA
jgi:hypothetical protein